jgi:hypothetical protein
LVQILPVCLIQVAKRLGVSVPVPVGKMPGQNISGFLLINNVLYSPVVCMSIYCLFAFGILNHSKKACRRLISQVDLEEKKPG